MESGGGIVDVQWRTAIGSGWCIGCGCDGLLFHWLMLTKTDTVIIILRIIVTIAVVFNVIDYVMVVLIGELRLHLFIVVVEFLFKILVAKGVQCAATRVH